MRAVRWRGRGSAQPAAAMPGKASQRGLPEPLFAGAAVLEATLKRLHAAEGRENLDSL